MTYAVAGARGIIEDPEKTIEDVHKWASARGGDVLVADAKAVFGRDHLETAVPGVPGRPRPGEGRAARCVPVRMRRPGFEPGNPCGTRP